MSTNFNINTLLMMIMTMMAKETAHILSRHFWNDRPLIKYKLNIEQNKCEMWMGTKIVRI